MIICEDLGNKEGKHKKKHDYWDKKGIEIKRIPIPVGDYIAMNDKIADVINRKTVRNIPIKKMDLLGTYKVCVDTKKDIQELVGDICGKQHERFRDECILAQNNGIKLYVLVENDREVVNSRLNVVNEPITKLSDMHRWVNKRLWIRKGGKQVYPNATKGITLQKACYSMQQKYGVEFLFCTSQESGAKILELLNV